MNIFVVDLDPRIAAQSLIDRHVIKMILENAQMMCHLAHKLKLPDVPYKDLGKAHHKHPCVLWLQQSSANYEWFKEYALELCREYTARYDKIHKSQAIIEWAVENNLDRNFPKIGLTPFALAVKQNVYLDIIANGDPVQTYRNFYIRDKASFATWKRNKPSWYTI